MLNSNEGALLRWHRGIMVKAWFSEIPRIEWAGNGIYITLHYKDMVCRCFSIRKFRKLLINAEVYVLFMHVRGEILPKNVGVHPFSGYWPLNSILKTF